MNLAQEAIRKGLTCFPEIQHDMWLLTLRGALALSPNVDVAKRVLDLGTGSGVWAIDYADTHPDAEVYYEIISKIWTLPNYRNRLLVSTSVPSSPPC